MREHVLVGLGAGIAVFVVICVAAIAWLALRTVFGDQPSALMIALAVGAGIVAFLIDWATDKRGKRGDE